MALLTRKGGGLPANYREAYFWLNHVEVLAEEPAQVATEVQAEAEAVPVAAEAAEEATRLEIPGVATERFAAEGKRAEADAELAQVEEELGAESAVPATDAAAEIATTAHAETAEAGLEEGLEIEYKSAEAAAEVAGLEEPAAETREAEVVSEPESEPTRKLANVRELPRRGGTMLGLHEEAATQQNEGEKSEAEEKERSRGFWGFRRRKRA